MKNVDTYTVIPFQVTDQGNLRPRRQRLSAVQQTAPAWDPLQYALLGGAILVVAGIVVWKRQ